MSDSHPAGFNPLRWNCERDGCFNKKMRPKIEVFADCFPGKINFGDVDAEVEMKGKFLQLEWKSDGGSLRTAQRIKFEAYTRNDGWAVIIVKGNAETMEVQGAAVFQEGKMGTWHECNLDQVKNAIKRWVSNTLK